jgi:hypothetical protein
LVGPERQKKEEIVKITLGSIFTGEASYSLIGFHVAFIRTLSCDSRFRHCEHLLYVNPILILIPTIPDCVSHVLSLSCPRPLPTRAETSAGRTRSRSRKRPITDVR